MNKITAINVLLKHAQKYSDPNYKADVQALTAACLFMETYLKKNKQDAKKTNFELLSRNPNRAINRWTMALFVGYGGTSNKKE